MKPCCLYMDLDHKTLEAQGEGLNLAFDKFKSWGSKKMTSVFAAFILYLIAEAAESLKLVGRINSLHSWYYSWLFRLNYRSRHGSSREKPFQKWLYLQKLPPFCSRYCQRWNLSCCACCLTHISSRIYTLGSPECKKALDE